MTHLLYLEDNYSVAFDSAIKSIDSEKGYIVLQDTLFHPQGGHQIFDTGVIEQGNISFDVVDVKNSNGEIQHYVGNKNNLKLANSNEPVKGKIDWERRYQLMKTHTAQHLFSAIAKNMFNMESVDMAIDVDSCSIKFDKSFEMTQIQAVQNEANKLIRQNLEVTRICNNDVYMVNIGEVDSRKCGCTHILKLKEIGQIYVCKTANNKVFFKVGLNAAAEQSQNELEILKLLATTKLPLSEISVGYDDLLKKEKNLVAELTHLGRELFTKELSQKNKQYVSSNGNLIVVKRPELDIKTVVPIVNKYLETIKRAVVVICKNSTVMAFSNIETIPACNITDMFKFIDPKFKGGGNMKFSQGGAWNRDIQETYDLIECALLEVSAFCD